MKLITINPERCVGCQNCARACAFTQSGDFNIKNSNMRVGVYPEERYCLPLTCFQCEDAPCMEICPAGAITRNLKSNAVQINSQKCIGCKMCMLACPFGNIHFDAEKHVSTKCNLCDGDPQCIKFCVARALEFVEIQDAYEFKRLLAQSKLKGSV